MDPKRAAIRQARALEGTAEEVAELRDALKRLEQKIDYMIGRWEQMTALSARNLAGSGEPPPPAPSPKPAAKDAKEGGKRGKDEA